ncbi:MAG: MIP/aquaporin family protein [Candidatus Solibacter sp.]
MASKFLGEFMGTMVLVLMGNGSVANILLKESKAEGAGWLAITAGWAFAVMTGVFTAIACGSSDAHLNPAVTVGLAMRSGDFSNVAPYIVAQLLGAMAGATLVWLHFLPHWAATPDGETKFACFATSPAIDHRAANLFSEALGAFVLILVATAMGSKASGPLIPGLGPYLVGMLVWGIGLSLGGTTGYAINPARDLGPRLMHAILPIPGKCATNWNYAPVPVIGPVVGAAVAGLLVKVIGF